MINYEFNIDLQILEVYYLGDINLSDLMDYGEMVRQNNSLPRDLKILTDATTAIYKFTPAEVTILFDALVEQIKSYSTVRTAVIQHKPLETALSFLVDSQEPIESYEHKVFSTRRAALDWLLS
jgi:hypothetical protein